MYSTFMSNGGFDEMNEVLGQWWFKTNKTDTRLKMQKLCRPIEGMDLYNKICKMTTEKSDAADTNNYNNR